MNPAMIMPLAAQKGAGMSNPDSFIDEVTEEMRRDKLFGYLRRYGWVAVLIVLGIVGGTAWNEYRSAQDRAAAQAAGDALLAALAENDEAARATAMAAVNAAGNAAVKLISDARVTSMSPKGPTATPISSGVIATPSAVIVILSAI